ncbi:hypothetical protein NDU88_008039 [Pleurodeles waltl]|uniref:Uncharacterized protein n=1 Tax=Pleurodeles waltl TaxID=8319 RepID=A0AAV7PV50_PLEWA|nr:hypothetical protein NDU88_008039 [Pleurodeles waltl]
MEGSHKRTCLSMQIGMSFPKSPAEDTCWNTDCSSCCNEWRKDQGNGVDAEVVDDNPCVRDGLVDNYDAVVIVFIDDAEVAVVILVVVVVTGVSGDSRNVEVVVDE